MEEPARLWCPSGSAARPESVVLGVHAEDPRDLRYLAEPMPAGDVLGLIPAGIEPTRILRFASHCESACAHRRGDDCTLVERISALEEPSDAQAVPRCHLRPHCKWWAQVGVEGCRRCPFVSTAARADDPKGVLMADPSATQEQLDAYLARQ